jgi:hypothetical protein
MNEVAANHHQVKSTHVAADMIDYSFGAGASTHAQQLPVGICEQVGIRDLDNA